MIEIDLIAIFIYVITGSIAGFSAGLLGIGGGLIIVPVLFYVFSFLSYESEHLMHMALATSLATIIITSLSSTIAHHRKGAVLWPVVFMLSPGIAVGAWLGADYATQLDTELLKPLFGIFELFVAGLMMIDFQSRQLKHSMSGYNAIVGGSIIGSLSAIIGIGGGTLTVPFLHWHNIDIKKAIATSAACGLPISIFATASYVYNGQLIAETTATLPASTTVTTSTLSTSFGFVRLDAFIVIATTSFMLAPFGAMTAHIIKGKNLKKIFAGVLLLLGTKMLLT